MKTRTNKTTSATTTLMFGFAVVCLMLASCAPATPTLPSATASTEPPVATSSQPSPQSSAYHEAPLLAEMVKAGTLPPIDQRLPQNAMLVQPEERTGVYGGVWHMAMVKTENNLFQRVIGYENLVRWDKGWTKVIPNVAQSYASSPDSKTFTFKLRQGMKWSDGQPFTANDVVFWYEALFLNDELQSLVEPWINVGKGNLTVEKQDDYTVVFQFTEPQGLFLQRMASAKGAFATNFPRHYLMQFHKAYNPDIDQLIAREGVANWVELFKKKTWPNVAVMPFSTVPEFPTLFAWVLEPDSFDANGSPAAVVKAVRNPYYWKIDTDYNQLPYIDRLEIQVVEEAADILPIVQAGNVDMQDRNIPAQAALPENQAKGGYGLYTLVSSFSNYMAISFNQTHADPVKRQIFQNKDFRIGLSHAINRPAIIQAAKLDVKPVQVAPLPGTPFYNERLANQYLEYSVTLANEYLDRAGYSQRNAAGLRLGPDGEPISFTMLIPTPVPTGELTVHLSMIQADWKAVGVEMNIEIVHRADADKRWDNSDYDVTAFTGAGGFDAILSARHYVPSETFWAQQGVRWSYWFSDPSDPKAEEPPAPVKETIALYRQALQTTDPEQQNKLMGQIMDSAAEQFHVIGIHTVPVSYGIVKTNFHNVPPLMFSSAFYPNPAPTNPCQYFIAPQT
jgi:peptide/nickel transport system substrate-binding protein